MFLKEGWFLAFVVDGAACSSLVFGVDANQITYVYVCVCIIVLVYTNLRGGIYVIHPVTNCPAVFLPRRDT